MNTTKVVFRIDNETKNVFALFPENPSDVWGLYCECYIPHNGHSSANYALCIATSKPATPEQYASIKHTLETQYTYRLKVLWRAGRGCQDRRIAAAYHRSLTIVNAESK